MCKSKIFTEIDCTKAINAIIETEMKHPHCDEIDKWWNEFYRGVEFFDDVNDGKPLNHTLVVKARRLEIDYLKKMRVL